MQGRIQRIEQYALIMSSRVIPRPKWCSGLRVKNDRIQGVDSIVPVKNSRDDGICWGPLPPQERIGLPFGIFDQPSVDRVQVVCGYKALSGISSFGLLFLLLQHSCLLYI